MGKARRNLAAVVGITGLVAGLVVSGTAAAKPASGASSSSPAPALGRLSTAQARVLARNPDRAVIVMFKNQESSLPATHALVRARTQAVSQVQAPVLRELRTLKAPNIHSVSLINAVTATVSTAEEARLAASPAVSAVIPDATTHLAFPTATRGASAATTATAKRLTASATRTAAAAPAASKATAAAGSAACQPGSNGVELDPEALGAIRANSNLPGSGPTAASLGITGAGVKVAYLAGGIDINDPDFIRPNGSHVFVDYKDLTGEGSTATTSDGEASLDASSVAAQGRQIYSITLPSGGTCKFRVLGAAPGASLVGLKVFPNNYDATTTSLLLGIDYAVVTDHVDVLNESFGYNPLPDTMTDVVRMADEAAVRAGTVVDVSSGDAGPTSTVGSPSTDPAVISAGATTTYRTYAQADIANYTGIGATGWENDNLSGLSSGGFTEGLKGPNVVAPGDLNWVACNPSPAAYEACISGGTSEAAPLTSATAALVIQAYRKTHGGASPTPALVKQIITSTATDLGLPAYEQGSGIVNAYRAVQAAMSVGTPTGSRSRTGITLLTSKNQISTTAPTSSVVKTNVAVTNTGTGTQQVRLHGRILSAPTTLASSRFSEPGGSWSKTIKFKVKPGTSRLAASVAEIPLNNNGSVDVTLVDPLGRLAIDGIPQGATATSNVDVRYPAAGTWTAYLTYSGSGSASASQPVDFTATAQDWQPFGTVSPSSVTLAAGATKSVSVAMKTPSSAGDESAAVQIDAPFGQRTTIPVALRALVPFRNGTGTFATSVTGGNGRSGATASTHYFAFDVPKGRSDLNLTTSYGNGPDNQYSTYLVSPQGETLGHASNQLVVGGTAANPVTTTEAGTTSHVLSPAAGRWTLVVAFANPASGASVTSPLHGTIDFSPVAVKASGLPDSTATTIGVGSTTVAKVEVTNHTAVPQSYFLDARLDHEVTRTLTPLTQGKGVALPLAGAIPQWVVPTDTTGLTGQVDATAPVTFDMSPYLGDFGGELNGDPQIGATSHGDTATATWSDNPITPGVWNLDPGLNGVWGPTGAPPATANLTMTAKTLAFNRSITTSYGDLWASPKSALHPVIVGPGQSSTLYAVIAPTAAGATTGTLYLDSASSINPFGNAIPAGDQLAAIPYKYTAKT